MREKFVCTSEKGSFKIQKRDVKLQDLDINYGVLSNIPGKTVKSI